MSRERKNWKNLPEDILGLTMDKLIRRDRVMMSLTCKDWSKINTTNNNEVLPWLLGYHHHTNKLLELSEPACGTGYFLKPKPPSHIDFSNIKLVDSKNGWILFLSQKYWDLFFYSPFTNEIIELPKLDLGWGVAGTFSSIPTSHDCVVMIGTIGDEETDYLEVSIIRLFDKCWKKIRLLKQKRGWENRIVGMVNVADCLFYCLFGYGEMSVFNLEIGEWKTLPGLRGQELYKFDNVLFVKGGDVFLHRHDRMWRLDLNLDEWVGDSVKMENVVFVNSSRAMWSALCIPAIGNAEQFGGTIFDLMEKPENISYTAWENPELEWYIWMIPPSQKSA